MAYFLPVGESARAKLMNRRWIRTTMLVALIATGIAAISAGVLFLREDTPLCDTIAPETWPAACIAKAEGLALKGDVKAMEGLWLAYPNHANKPRAFYWLLEAARRGSVNASWGLVEFCSQNEQVSRPVVMTVLNEIAKLNQPLAEKMLIRLNKTCPE